MNKYLGGTALVLSIALFVSTLDATVSSTTSRVAYAGDGSTTSFSFPYIFQSNTDLVVYLRDTTTLAATLQTYTTNYTVTGKSNPSGGTVIMNTAPTSGQQLVIYRDPARTQDLSLNDGGAISYKQIELRLDKLTLQAQRFADIAARSVRQADGDTASLSPSLPVDLANSATYVLGLNSTATGWKLYPQIPAGATASSILFSNNGAAGVVAAGLNAVPPLTITGVSGGYAQVGVIDGPTFGNANLTGNTKGVNGSFSGTMDITGNTNVVNYKATGNTNGVNGNFSGTMDITGNTNVVNYKATGNTNGVNGNFSGTMDITGNENVVNLKSTGNVNGANGNFSGTMDITGNENVVNFKATGNVNGTGNANFSGNLIVPNSAGAPAGAAAGSFYNDTTQQAPTVNAPIRSSFPLSGILNILTADSTVSNTASETLIGAAYTVPANVFAVGKTIRFTTRGVYSQVAATAPIFTAKLRAGGTGGTAMITQAGIGLGAAVAPATGASNSLFEWVVDMTCRTTGAGGTFMTTGRFEYATVSSGGVAVFGGFSTAATLGTVPLSTSVTEALQETITISAAAAGNTITVKSQTIEALN